MAADSGSATTEQDSSSRPEIQVLPDHIIDQIAAGEVVERPASVVKELVENSLDAGATHITIEVEAGGKELVRVLDNGCGMSGSQVRLALRRHATSKLRALSDLFGIDTMGFRGEALPSIAAISRMTITTRSRADAAPARPSEVVAGTRLHIEGGRLVDSTEVGAPVGTQIEVRSLLYNVPARLKFLKGDATEASHITDTVTKLALAHPWVHFRLRHRGRKTIDAPLHANALERVQALLGTRLGGRLHKVSGREGGVEVAAFLAAPELSQTTSRGLQMFVGKRAVKDRGLLHAVKMGYGELLPKGRFPVAVLFVDVPGDEVDVNVHPRKLEVRFSDPQAVYAAVRHVIGRGVGEAPWLSDPLPAGVAPVRMQVIASNAPPDVAGDGGMARPGSRASDMAASYAAQRTRMLLPWRRATARAARDGHGTQTTAFPVAGPAPDVSVVPRAQGGQQQSEPHQQSNAGATGGEPRPTWNDVTRERTAAVPAEPTSASYFFRDLRYLGQLDRTYLVCEAGSEMVLIDQHAAHERVAFQRLRERYHERSVPVQRMLFPQKVELTEQQAAVTTDSADELAAVGFEIQHFGGSTWAIKAVPAALRAAGASRSGRDVALVLRELLDELANQGASDAVGDRLDAVFATIACHSVVRAGDTLSQREVEALFESLDAVDFKAHCPHGRPVLLRIGIAEIARRFGRT